MTERMADADLLARGRGVFAAHGYDISLSRLAGLCGLSSRNPIYDLGGKSGFYEEIVKCEVAKVLAVIEDAVAEASQPLPTLRRIASGLVDYVAENPDGFRILMRDSPPGAPGVLTLLGQVTTQVEHLLAEEFDRLGLESKSAPLYAQMLVGMLGQTGLYWLDHRSA